MIRYIFKQIRRSLVPNISFCLLLALAGTLLCLGTGLLMTAIRSIEDAEEAFTTIAMPDVSSMRRYVQNYIRDNRITEYTSRYGVTYTSESWGFKEFLPIWLQEDIEDNIREKVFESGVFTMDPRRMLGAYAPGVLPYVDTGHEANRSLPTSTMAFIAVAESVKTVYTPRQTWSEAGGIQYEIVEELEVVFTIEDPVLLHPAYNPPNAPLKRIRMEIGHYHPDGSPLVKEGKRYFIYGRETYPGGPQMIVIPRSSASYSFDSMFLAAEYATIDDVPQSVRAAVRSMRLSEDNWPVRSYRQAGFGQVSLHDASDAGYRTVIELPDDPGALLPDGLQNEIGAMLEVLEKSVRSLTILTTEALDTYFRFHQKRAFIREGRNFSKEEIAEGARVCLINEAIERVEIGDKITLQVYETDFMRTGFSGGAGGNTTFWLWVPKPYYFTALIAEPMEFEVIGTFRAPLYDNNDYAIPYNAVIVPDGSVDGLQLALPPDLAGGLDQDLEEWGMSYEDWYARRGGTMYTHIPLLNTIVVPNGRNEEFAAAVNALLPEYSAFFRIYDQGYSTVKGALDNLLRGGILILALCLAGWLIAALVFCLFYVLRKRKDAGTLYALGVSRKHRFRWVFTQSLIVVCAAMVIAFGASSALYEHTMAIAFETAQNSGEERDSMFSDAVVATDGATNEFAIRHDPFAVPLAVAGQLAALLVFAGGVSAVVTKRGLYSMRGADG
jgi:hypothetical protein